MEISGRWGIWYGVVRGGRLSRLALSVHGTCLVIRGHVVSLGFGHGLEVWVGAFRNYSNWALWYLGYLFYRW